MPLEEVEEIIALADFDAKAARKLMAAGETEISPIAAKQLKVFVTRIADLYRDNAFHSFEHASHVVMATIKYLNRILTSDSLGGESAKNRSRAKAQNLHNMTYGISSDPLVHLACIFSAVIHDADHVRTLFLELSLVWKMYSRRCSSFFLSFIARCSEFSHDRGNA